MISEPAERAGRAATATGRHVGARAATRTDMASIKDATWSAPKKNLLEDINLRSIVLVVSVVGHTASDHADHAEERRRT